MSTRMDNAMEMAESCWTKAINAEPEFVRQYLALCEHLLMLRIEVCGDEFKEHCRNNKLFLPDTLHHNTWVSGVRAMEQMGWIVRIGYLEPTKWHNHMNKVSWWASRLFVKSAAKRKKIAQIGVISPSQITPISTTQ